MIKPIIKTAILIVLFILGCESNVYSGALEQCSEYASIGVPSTDNLLCKKGFLLGYNKINKTPDWVIEHLTKSKVTSTLVKRTNNFEPDPDISVTERDNNEDYTKSGYDRGHMAPVDDMTWDKDAMNQCFYLSNMVPQIPNMNRGIWKVLETSIRKSVKTRGDLFIITGPIYADQEKKTIGKDKIAIPTHLYKIIYDESKQESEAFIIPNKKLDPKLLSTFIVTISDIEKQTGLKFITSINKDEFKNIKTLKLWK